MAIHLISDTHFNHDQLEEWDGRSGDWQNRLLSGMELLPPEDLLIHLGDVCIGNDAEVHETLRSFKSKKILVKGNHDNKSTNWYLNHGWDFVCDGFELQHHGYMLWLSHHPAPPNPRYHFNIHGHTHGNLHRAEEYGVYHDPKYHIDLSPEVVGYQPIQLDTIIKKIRKDRMTELKEKKEGA